MTYDLRRSSCVKLWKSAFESWNRRNFSGYFFTHARAARAGRRGDICRLGTY